jgi:glycosyltransferase involved in cell wall biosynthesis
MDRDINLTVGIPTYNRHKKLNDCLEALSRNDLHGGIEILIIDNHSEPPITLNSAMIEMQSMGILRIIRNVANIGLAANVNRVFEYARGKWVWLLGDDDIPLQQATQRIADELISSDTERLFLLKFNSTNGGQVAQHEIVQSLADLSIRCKDAKFFSNFLFISSSVFKREVYLRFLHTAYQWNTTLAPHLAVSANALQAGFHARLVPHELVKHGMATSDGWNYQRLISGLSLLAELEGCSKEMECILKSTVRNSFRRRWWLHVPATFFCSKDRSSDFWKHYWSRLGLVCGGLRGLYALLCSLVLPPLASLPLLRRWAKIFKVPSIDAVNLDRS